MTFFAHPRARAAVLASLAVGTFVENSFAADGAEPAADAGVAFHAQRLELDPKLSRLELGGDVAVTVDRYRLTSDRLVVTRGPLGVLVEGEGRVAFCPCPDPPVTLGFARALIAPPTDLLLTSPTLRIAGVPVLWLPYLWLRSPRRAGVLPLKLEWRGADGLLVGSGVHVPVGGDDLDLRAAGYAKGGVELETRFTTPATTTSVRWDYLRQGLIAADLRGSSSPEPHASVAWSADALRGSRALRGPVGLDEVSLRDDRARIAAGFSDGTSTLGMTFRADTPRGGPVGVVDAYGPGLHAGFGTGFGTIGAVDADADVATFRETAGTSMMLVGQHGEVRFEPRAGPVQIDVAGRTRALGTFNDDAAGHVAAAGVEAKVELPFVKDFGPVAAPMQHWVTPFAAGTVGIADSRGTSVAVPVAPNGGFFTAMGGVRSTVGELGGQRRAVSFEAQAGLLGDRNDSAEPAAAFTAAGGTAFAALRLESVLVRGAATSALNLGEVRIGPSAGPFLKGRISAQAGTVPVLSRLVVAGWDAPWTPYFSEPGRSVGGGAGIPWTRAVATSADADYDVSNRTLLGLNGKVTYRHPCGCLAATLWAGHRLGRTGVDSFLTVDLMP